MSDIEENDLQYEEEEESEYGEKEEKLDEQEEIGEEEVLAELDQHSEDFNPLDFDSYSCVMGDQDGREIWAQINNESKIIDRLKKILLKMKEEQIFNPPLVKEIQSTIARIQQLSEDIKEEKEAEETLSIEELGAEEFGAEQLGAEEFRAEEFGAEEFRAEKFGAEEFGAEEFGAEELRKPHEKTRKINQMKKIVDELYYGDEWVKTLIPPPTSTTLPREVSYEEIVEQVKSYEGGEYLEGDEGVADDDDDDLDLVSDEFYLSDESECESEEEEEKRRDSEVSRKKTVVDDQPVDVEETPGDKETQTLFPRYEHEFPYDPRKVQMFYFATDETVEAEQNQEMNRKRAEQKRMERAKHDVSYLYNFKAYLLESDDEEYIESESQDVEEEEEEKKAAEAPEAPEAPETETRKTVISEEEGDAGRKTLSADEKAGTRKTLVSEGEKKARRTLSITEEKARKTMARKTMANEEAKAVDETVADGFMDDEVSKSRDRGSVNLDAQSDFVLESEAEDVEELGEEYEEVEEHKDQSLRDKFGISDKATDAVVKVSFGGCMQLEGSSQDVISVFSVFGFDPGRRFIVYEIDKDSLVFCSGNFIHILNLETGEKESRVSISGGGIGCMTTYSPKRMIVVCENGDSSYIIVYRWPTFRVVAIFEGSKTMRKFLDVDVSPDGKFLCTQGSHPHNAIAIWSIKKKRLLTWCRNFTPVPCKTEFVTTNPFHANLISFGYGKLTFWRLVVTLRGHTMYLSDADKKNERVPDIKSIKVLRREMIEAMLSEERKKEQDAKKGDDHDEEAAPQEEEKSTDAERTLPSKSDVSWIFNKEKDYQVLAGTSEGTLLVYQREKYKGEITRKDRQPLHDDGAIIYINLDLEMGKVITVGKNGIYKMWDYKDISEVSKVSLHTVRCEMQESYEGRILLEGGEPVEINYIIKSETEEDYIIQDPRGNIYRAGLKASGEDEIAELLFNSHIGPITGMAASPYGYYLAVVTSIGELYIFNTSKKHIAGNKMFKIGCSTITWLSLEVDHTGTIVLIGFNDGTMRSLALSVDFKEATSSEEDCINIIQAFKPHTKKITSIKVSYNNELVASSSWDQTIVLYEIVPFATHYLKLLALNAIRTDGPINFMIWKNSLVDLSILITCNNGYFGEYKIPTYLRHFRSKTLTYYIKVPKRICHYQRVKKDKRIIPSQLAEGIIDKKRVELSDVSSSSSDHLFNETMEFPRYKHSITEGLNICIPREFTYIIHNPIVDDLVYVPNKIQKPVNILCASYINDDTVWVSAEEESDLLHEYVLGASTPANCYELDFGDKNPITCFLFLFNYEYIVFGTKKGKIRLIKRNKEKWFDFSDYAELSTHDPVNGAVTYFCLSAGNNMLYSGSLDGNIVTYFLKVDRDKYGEQITQPRFVPLPEVTVDDDIPEDAPPIQKSRLDKTQSSIRENTIELIAKQVEELRDEYDRILKQNKNLPPEIKVTEKCFALPSLENEMNSFLDKKKKNLEKKYNYEYFKIDQFLKNIKNYFSEDLQTHLVYLIHTQKPHIKVTSYRTYKFDDFFLKIEKEVTEALKINNKMEKIFNSVKPAKKFYDSFHEGVKKKPNPVGRVSKDSDDFEKYILRNQTLIERFGKEKREYFYQLYTDRCRIKDLNNQLKELYRIPHQKFVEGTDEEFEERIKEEKIKNFKAFEKKRGPTRDQITYCLIKFMRYLHNAKEEFNKKILATRDLKLETVYDQKLAIRDTSYIAKEMRLPKGFEMAPAPPFDRLLEFPESYNERHPAKFVPDEPIPPVSEEWVTEYYSIYGNRDPSEFIGENFQSDVLDETVNFLLAKGMNLTQITKRIKRFERFKARISEISNATAKLSLYDNQVEDLAYEKVIVDERISQLHFIASSLYQELFILRFYGVLEDKVHESMDPCIAKRFCICIKLEVERKRLQQVRQAKMIAIRKRTALELEAMEIIPDKSKYSKKLRRLFYGPKRRVGVRLTKQSRTTTAMISEELSDESSDMNECPKDLDEEIYRKIILLRERRNQEREAAELFRTKEDEITNQFCHFTKKKLCIEVIIGIYSLQLSRYTKDKEEQIGNLNVTLIMKPSELQCFDPKTNHLVDNPIFTTVEMMKKHEADNISLKQEEEFTRLQVRKRFTYMKRILLDIKRLGQKKEKIDNELKERMMTRFGNEIDMQDMIEYALKGLVNSQKDKQTSLERGLENEMELLKEKLYDRTTQLLEITKENTNNIHIKCALLEEKNRTTEFLLKERKKPLFEIKQLEEHVEKLKKQVNKEEERKMYLLKKIAQLRTKGDICISEEEAATEEDESSMKKTKEDSELFQFGDSETALSEVSEAAGPSDKFDTELEDGELTRVIQEDELVGEDKEDSEYAAKEFYGEGEMVGGEGEMEGGRYEMVGGEGEMEGESEDYTDIGEEGSEYKTKASTTSLAESGEITETEDTEREDDEDEHGSQETIDKGEGQSSGEHLKEDSIEETDETDAEKVGSSDEVGDTAKEDSKEEQDDKSGDETEED